MKSIAFICTGNSARSQIAEAVAKKLAKEKGLDLKIFSAGSKPAGFVHPLAKQVLTENGFEVDGLFSKSMNDIPIKDVDIIITLCSEAEKECPVFPGKKIYHWRLKDPAKENTKEAFEKTLKEIKERMGEFFNEVFSP